MYPPEISIVTACLNAEDTIEQCLLSVLGQRDYAGRVEHVIVDGCSTDRTLDIVRSHDHVRVVSEPDEGFYDAVNKGLRIVTGKYVGILNADDWYEETTFAKVVEGFHSAPNVGVVHGDMLSWLDGKPFRVERHKSHQRFYSMWIRHPTAFVRRSVYEQHGLFDTRYQVQADYDLMLRLRKAGVKMHYVPHTLTNFRLGGLSTNKWSLEESVSVRVRNGVPLPWAFVSAVTVRSIFESRMLAKSLLQRGL